jgi:predicted ATPase
MLVAVSGSQGCGKSTVVQALQDKGFPTITRKTARSILADWGVTLQQVNVDHDLTVKYQDELLVRKYQDDLVALNDPSSIWFTERTFADLFTYALITLGKENKYSEWLNNYHAKCMEYQQIYDRIFYLKAGHFSTKHDGVRGSNHHYSRMVDMVMHDVTANMTHPSVLIPIDTGCLEQRVSSIIHLSNKNL